MFYIIFGKLLDSTFRMCKEISTFAKIWPLFARWDMQKCLLNFNVLRHNLEKLKMRISGSQLFVAKYVAIFCEISGQTLANSTFFGH